MFLLRNFLVRLKGWLVDPYPTRLPLSVAAAPANPITWQGNALVAAAPANPITWQGDALCFVLANVRQASQVYLILDYFLPHRDPLREEYELMDEDAGIAFTDEAQLLSYLEDNPARDATRYWYPQENNPAGYMVGAHFTADGCLLLSLTLPGNEIDEDHCLAQMKTLLNSVIGLIWYNSFPNFSLTGENFRKQYAASA